MNCPECMKANPTGATFCIYCSAPLPTTDPSATSETAKETSLPARQQTTSWLPAQQSRKLAGAIWLIGLGVLWLTGFIWPGVLVLVGITAFVEEDRRGRRTEGIRTLIFFSGIAVLFWAGVFWPGILVLLGIIMILSPELRPPRTV